MVGSREKGKIAHDEWPGIVARHGAGESFASIARSYGCTAPAIRYIVGREAKLSTGMRKTAKTPAISIEDKMAAPEQNVVGRPQSFRKGIDQKLRERVNSDIAAFLVAFDIAFEQDTAAHREALLEATDRLLRAGARTRIVLEEMEESERHVEHHQQFHARRASSANRPRS